LTLVPIQTSQIITASPTFVQISPSLTNPMASTETSRTDIDARGDVLVAVTVSPPVEMGTPVTRSVLSWLFVITLSNHPCKIPYASTFDGGLGCFARDWTNSGRNLGSLYRYATHRCVSSHDSSGKFELASLDCPSYQACSTWIGAWQFL